MAWGSEFGLRGLGLRTPKAPCTFIVDTLALKYLHRDPFKASVYAIWVHGAFGLLNET